MDILDILDQTAFFSRYRSLNYIYTVPLNLRDMSPNRDVVIYNYNK